MKDLKELKLGITTGKFIKKYKLKLDVSNLLNFLKRNVDDLENTVLVKKNENTYDKTYITNEKKLLEILRRYGLI